MTVSYSSQSIQADEYAFPYHYLPIPGSRPRLTRHWPFAPSYLAALTILQDWITALPTAEQDRRWQHIDIGCGDGALLYHLSMLPGLADAIELYGIDYDARALKWAQQFNRRASILEADIDELEPSAYDSASLVEVAEHIPPDELSSFLAGAARALRPGGQLALTVPSVEKPLQAKHFQHFSFDNLRGYVADHFEIVALYGFERHTLISKALHILMYRKRIRIEFPNSSKVMVRTLGRLHEKQKGAGRIFAILRKKMETSDGDLR